MHAALVFIAVTTLHLVATIGLVIYVFGAGMARFDSGASATAAETLQGWVLNTLSFPLLIALKQSLALRFPGLWGYVPFAVNSALWGMAAVLIYRRWRRQRSRRATSRA